MSFCHINFILNNDDLVVKTLQVEDARRDLLKVGESFSDSEKSELRRAIMILGGDVYDYSRNEVLEVFFGE